MHKTYRTFNKIVKNEDGQVIEIQKKNGMNKAKIDFGNCIISYNFSTSKNCGMKTIVKSQIRRLKRKVI